MNSTNAVFDILKNVPSGVKLYCTLIGEVTVCDLKENLITVKNEGDIKITLNEKGCIILEGVTYPKCVLFPSEEELSWDGWQITLFRNAYQTNNKLFIKFKDEVYLAEPEFGNEISWNIINSKCKISSIKTKDIKECVFPSTEEINDFITKTINFLKL